MIQCTPMYILSLGIFGCSPLETRRFNSGPSSVLGQRMPRVLSLTARARHWTDGTERGAIGVPQTPIQRDEKFARARMVPMFAQPDALPRTQVQFSFGYRNGKRRTQETRLYVGRLLIVIR